MDFGLYLLTLVSSGSALAAKGVLEEIGKGSGKAIFEKIKSPYLISTIYKERGDMHKELQEAEQAQNCYEQCVRLRKQAVGANHSHF